MVNKPKNWENSFCISLLAYAGIIGVIIIAGGCRREPIGGFNDASKSNLKVLGHAMEQYTQDHQNQLPLMNNWSDVEKSLLPYIDNVRTFSQPGTVHDYKANVWLSGKSVTIVTAPGQVVLFYEAQPSSDSTRGFVVLDGHTKRIPETQWPHYKILSHIQ